MPLRKFQIHHLTNPISPVLLVILSIVIWWLSGEFPSLEEGYPGPNLFPRIIAVALGTIGILLFKNNYRRKTIGLDVSKVEKNSHPSRLSLGVCLMIFFPILTPLIGFLLSLLIVSIAMGLTFQLVWWKAALTGLVTVSSVYIIFSFLLGVML